ncbi:hypothetical protein HRbin16_02770 [bacterium HR16]|nr:hypothetical protein HRbin16_02770 [bacterium HR16]
MKGMLALSISYRSENTQASVRPIFLLCSQMLDKSGRNAVRFCSLSKVIVGEGEAPAEPCEMPPPGLPVDEEVASLLTSPLDGRGKAPRSRGGLGG